MSDWIYQSVTEIELRQKGKEAIEASKCSQNKNNIKMIEQLVYRLSLNEDGTRFNRKKYVCLLQEFIRDTCELENKTVNEVYMIYKEALSSSSKSTVAKIGWNSELFDADRKAEEEEIEKIKKPLEIESGVYTCPRCGKNKTYSRTTQTRRADEAGTDFVFCLNPSCNYVFRVYD